MKNIENTALITGASSGIGLAIATGLASSGINVIGTYKTKGALERKQVTEALSKHNNICFIEVDFENEINIQKLINDAEKIYKSHINILINNAAIFSRKSLHNQDIDEWEKIFKVNVRIPFELSKEVSKRLIDLCECGSFVHISSLSSKKARSQMIAYEASKAALNMISNSLSYQLAKYGIRSNVILPGLIQTPANEIQRLGDETVWLERQNSIPCGRCGIPEDVVGAVMFLISDASSYVSGSEIVIDGAASTF